MSPENPFPSPTDLLQPSDDDAITPPSPSTKRTAPPASKPKKKIISPKQSRAKAKAEQGPPKPKQSKSRNGCSTCKQKRLKCDESKPVCVQCTKRQVDCGGYKKDWKWKEGMVMNKPPAPSRPKKKIILDKKKPAPRFENSPPASDGSGSTVTPDSFADTPTARRPPSPTCSPPNDIKPPPQLNHASSVDFAPSIQPFSLETSLDAIIAPSGSATGLTPAVAGFGFPSRSAPGYSQTLGFPPRPSGLFIPADSPDSAGIESQDQNSLSGLGLDLSDVASDDSTVDFDDDEIEEVMRTSDNAVVSHQRNGSFGFTTGMSNFDISDRFINQQPRFSPYSAEMLMSQFDKRTCGILSVRDGQNENPWRTMIFPLVKDSNALYHAIASMTAFHSSKNRPDMKLQALEHRTKSIKLLKSGIQGMRPDIAIAITLVLAFAESWDGEVSASTGIQHLRGAKAFLNEALLAAQTLETSFMESNRIKFLCNTWVYMDVIARLTSIENDYTEDFHSSLLTSVKHFGGLHDIDPLMGCASSMFPIIGRVANLVRIVRSRRSNSIKIIEQASELKRELDEWQPPYPFDEPDDEQCNITAALQTAEAYRWATLLYLHQAVPEIPSRTAGQLAKKALIKLALVPLSSRTIIVQIYPLLAAGCEAHNEEDRAWVRDRWTSMARTMNIANIDRCQEVVREVWNRRDAYDEAMLEQRLRQARVDSTSSSMFSPTRTSFSPVDDPSAWGLADLGRGGSLSGDMDLMPDYGVPQNRQSQGSMDWSGGMRMGRGRPARVDPESLSPANVGGRARTESEEAREELHVERTVRGRQHWIGVMEDWDWEVLLG